MAEFGWYGGGQLTINQGRHPPATESQQANWRRAAIEGTRDLADGWLNWGVFDHPEAGDVSQLTGLFTAAGRPKEWANVFRDLSFGLADQASAAKGRGDAATPLPVAEFDWDRAIVDPQVGRQALEEAAQAANPASRSWLEARVSTVRAGRREGRSRILSTRRNRVALGEIALFHRIR